MGFLDALSAAITPATQYRTGQLQGAEQKKEKEQDSFLKALQLARQQQEDALNDSIKREQLRTLQQKPAVPNQIVPQGAAVVGPDGKPLFTNPKETAQQHVVDPATGEVKFFDPTNPPSDLRVHPTPKEPTIIQGVDDAGNPIAYRVPKSGGEATPVEGFQGKKATRIESAINTAAQARLTAAVSEMNNAHSNMDEFENELATGKRKISASAQLLQRVANTFTHDDPVSQAAQSVALATLNQTDPELARYIRRGLSFAEGESMISQRPSDFRTRMAAFLSAAASGASPDMIRDIQSRRQSIMDPLNAAVAPKATPKTGRDEQGGKSMSPAAYKAARAAGYTDAEIRAQGYAIPKGGGE